LSFRKSKNSLGQKETKKRIYISRHVVFRWTTIHTHLIGKN